MITDSVFFVKIKIGDVELKRIMWGSPLKLLIAVMLTFGLFTPSISFAQSNSKAVESFVIDVIEKNNDGFDETTDYKYIDSVYAIEENSLNNIPDETIVDSDIITPFNTSKPKLQNPYLGGGGIPNFGTAMSVGGRSTSHSTATATTTSSSLPSTSTRYSSKDLIYNNAIKQRRYYDQFGDAIQDIDYFHSGVGHEFPHIHYFNWYNIIPRSGSYPATF